MREAVLRLADEGLIDIFPQSGTFVSRIPIGALPEAMVIRRTLEETSARLAAERASGAQIEAIEAVLKRQREVAARGDQDAFHDADEAFHAAITEAAGLPRLWPLVQQVKVQVDRVRRLTLPQKGRMPLLIREHAAVAARDQEARPRRGGGADGRPPRPAPARARGLAPPQPRLLHSGGGALARRGIGGATFRRGAGAR